MDRRNRAPNPQPCDRPQPPAAPLSDQNVLLTNVLVQDNSKANRQISIGLREQVNPGVFGDSLTFLCTKYINKTADWNKT